MNPVMALGMKQNAFLRTAGAALHTGDAIGEPPSCDPGDLCVAHRAEAALFVPEKAKKTGTLERTPHMIRFAFLEVSLIDRIVGVRFASNLDVSLDGGTTSQE
jgi:hypothetical protein